MDDNILNYETVALDDERGALLILDQSKLPGSVEVLALTGQGEIWEAIRALKVRGAPAIGIAAAIGLYLAAREIEADGFDDFIAGLKERKAFLATARPTAVNLFWALERMMRAAEGSRGKSLPEVKALLRDEALCIKAEDEAACKAIGEHGLSLLEDGWGILTHCNAGQLAASKYGTALAPILLGREQGYNFRVFADETRPLLQGARLTAFELVRAGVDATLICDNMASQVMKNGWINAVFTGADRVAANGDACNKIGTSGLAILAKHYGIPFYICAPVSTIDLDTPRGEDIPIEERPGHEITDMWYSRPMAPEGVKVYNPAFDVAEHRLITAIITERGIARPPYGESLRKLLAL